MIKSGGKRGQVTVFIIIAVIIVALAAVVYFVYPKIRATTTTTSPSDYIQQCIEKDLEENIQKIAMQGGSFNPQNYHSYNDEKIEYICYINEYYKPCIMQHPFLKQYIEDEIQNSIQEKTKSCFDDLEQNYRNQGYEVNLNRQNYSIELLPNKIVSKFNYDLTLTKGSSNNYKNFMVAIDNNLFELAAIAESIVKSEAQYGDSEITEYMTYYPWLKVEKRLRDDGTKIYILTDRDTKDQFEFAIRSVVWPPGYGI